jgi:DNA-binding NarL/FixJ family response regulator
MPIDLGSRPTMSWSAPGWSVRGRWNTQSVASVRHPASLTCTCCRPSHLSRTTEDYPLSHDLKVRILLADAHSLFRDAIKTVLKNEEDLEVVAEARDGVQAVTEAERSQPDVALIDAALPNCDGIQATRLIKQRLQHPRILILDGEESQETLVAAIGAGASGYLTKECPLAELLEATRAIHRGETLIPPKMLGSLLAHLIRRRRETGDAVKRMTRLTRRERQVLALLSDGADNDAIAQSLVISPQTARTHIQNVLGKLGVHSRLEAAAFVIQHGVLEELAMVDA